MKTAQTTIPNGWQQAKLGDIAKLRKGLTYKSSHYSNKQDGLIFLTLKSILRGGGFNTDGIKFYSGDYDPSAVVNEDDLVIANTDITRDAEVVGAPMLLPGFPKKPVLISMDLSVLDINERGANKHFIYYLLQAPMARNFMRDHSNGSTVLHLKTKDVPRFSFLMPTITEQKKIAEILGTVDAEIKKTDEIIIATEKLKNGLVRQLFTRGIGHTKFKKTKFGDIPAEWTTESFKDSSIEIIDGDRGVNYPKQTDFSDDGYCLFLNNKNIKNDAFLFEDCSFITKEKDGTLRKGKLKRFDVVLTTRGTVGNIAFYDSTVPFENIRINSGMLILRVSRGYEPEFLYRLMRNEYMKRKYTETASGSAQPQLPIRSLENILIVKPDISEQKEIVAIAKSVDEKISVNKKLREKLILLKKGLMQDLLSGKVRVVT
ncbi:MAG: restriction endonuclease subunit S [Minisyncoccia bacterium]|jgi:type I restriction enzyme S subunit